VTSISHSTFDMKFKCVIQARTKSTRLPRKILADIENISILEHIAQRLNLLHNKVSYCFAIPRNESKEIYDLFESKQIPWIEGDEKNVLQRYQDACYDLTTRDYIIRLTGDNPFIDFAAMEKLIQLPDIINHDLIYPSKLPLGMGFEIISVKALFKQNNYTLSPHHHEHVSTFIKENRTIFSIQEIILYKNAPDIRLTIDYPEDLETARGIAHYFYSIKKPFFTTDDVYQLFNNKPELFEKNINLEQRKPTHYEK